MDLKQNYFEVFGLPVDYSVDQDDLSNRFVELQKEIHPDRFAGKSDHEKRLSMQWATLVNSAFDTLKSPLRRAIYMVEMDGQKIPENPVLPPDFLMEQIALREELEAIEEGDGDLDRLDRFRMQVTSVLQELEQSFGEAIGSDRTAAETVVYEMQFMNRLLQAARQLEEKMLDY